MLNIHNPELSLIRIAGITDDSIVDGPGIRLTIFVQGCPHHCPGCHNPQTHDFSGGKNYSIAELLSKIDQNPILYGVTFSGGEPFCQPEELNILAKAIKQRNLHLVIYTGFLYETLQEMAGKNQAIDELLKQTDWLIDGPFIEAQKDLTLKFRGSQNQRIIILK